MFHTNLHKYCDYRQNLCKIVLYVRIKVPTIVKISYMTYSKFYYALLDLKKDVIFAYFNVTIYIEFEFFVYLVN